MTWTTRKCISLSKGALRLSLFQWLQPTWMRWLRQWKPYFPRFGATLPWAWGWWLVGIPNALCTFEKEQYKYQNQEDNVSVRNTEGTEGQRFIWRSCATISWCGMPVAWTFTHIKDLWHLCNRAAQHRMKQTAMNAQTISITERMVLEQMWEMTQQLGLISKCSTLESAVRKEIGRTKTEPERSQCRFGKDSKTGSFHEHITQHLSILQQRDGSSELQEMRQMIRMAEEQERTRQRGIAEEMTNIHGEREIRGEIYALALQNERQEIRFAMHGLAERHIDTRYKTLRSMQMSDFLDILITIRQYWQDHMDELDMMNLIYVTPQPSPDTTFGHDMLHLIVDMRPERPFCPVLYSATYRHSIFDPGIIVFTTHRQQRRIDFREALGRSGASLACNESGTQCNAYAKATDIQGEEIMPEIGMYCRILVMRQTPQHGERRAEQMQDAGSARGMAPHMRQMRTMEANEDRQELCYMRSSPHHPLW